MIIHCTRTHLHPDRTLSRVHIEYDGPMRYSYVGWQPQSSPSPDRHLFGWALEDQDRGLDTTMTLAEIAAIKVHGTTAIPTGDYDVAITMSRRWGRVMPQIVGVPGFGGVRPHAGNGPRDTEGCPLLGLSMEGGKMVDSRLAAAWVERRISECSARGERVRWRVATAAQ